MWNGVSTNPCTVKTWSNNNKEQTVRRYVEKIWWDKWCTTNMAKNEKVEENLKLRIKYEIFRAYSTRHYFIIGVEQFPSCTSKKMFLQSIFLSLMSASIFFKVRQNRETNKTNKRTILFLPIKYFWDELYKIWMEGPFWKISFLKMILSTRRKVKSSIFSERWSKKQNGYQNRIYPSSWLQ